MSERMSVQEVAAEIDAERDFHNRAYERSTPFGLGSAPLDVEKVWASLRPIHEVGGHIRGQRNTRFFELMDFDTISGKRVIDLGCGDGSAGLFAALHGADVIGFDISEIGVAQANKHAKINGVNDHCRFLVGEASATGLESESADIVVLKAVLHHFIKYPGIEQEIWRVLKPGGHVVFADILRDNAVYNLLTRIYHATGVETDHGEQITCEDYERFAASYENVVFEHRSIIESFKRVVPKGLRGNVLFRKLVRGLVLVDSALLRTFPGLKSQTLEIVGKMRKPA